MDYSDIINELSKRYKELQKEFKSVQDLVNDIDFVFDYTEEEQWLFYRMRSTMEEHCAALLRLIRFLRKQELEEQEEHCGQDTRHRDEAAKKLCDLLVKGRMAVYAPGKKCNKCGANLFEGFGTEEGGEIICFNCANQITNEELQQALDEYREACLNHCGQDAEEPRHDYRAMVEGQGIHIHDGNVPLDQCGCIKIKCGQAQDPNESQPVDTVPESLQELVGMQIVSVFPPGHKCQGCLFDRDYFRCEKKVELVGGYYLCLAPIPIVTE